MNIELEDALISQRYRVTLLECFANGKTLIHNGIEYPPNGKLPPMNDDIDSYSIKVDPFDIRDVLDYRWDRNDIGNVTIRQYLIKLSHRCWIDEESFGGKRPFGNSGWKHDLYGALCDGGFLHGTKDDCGFWTYDNSEGDRIITMCYDHLLGET